MCISVSLYAPGPGYRCRVAASLALGSEGMKSCQSPNWLTGSVSLKVRSAGPTAAGWTGRKERQTGVLWRSQDISSSLEASNNHRPSAPECALNRLVPPPITNEARLAPLKTNT